jgi:hypothetical protein
VGHYEGVGGRKEGLIKKVRVRFCNYASIVFNSEKRSGLAGGGAESDGLIDLFRSALRTEKPILGHQSKGGTVQNQDSGRRVHRGRCRLRRWAKRGQMVPTDNYFLLYIVIRVSFAGR